MPLSNITWAIARTEIEDATRFRVLVVMANHSDESGLCWPKNETVATQVARGDRQVRDHLSGLVDDGYLARVRVRRNGGRLGGYLYRVLAPGVRAVEPDDLPRWAANTDIPESWMRPIPNDQRQPTAGGGPPDTSGTPPPVDKRHSTAGQEPPNDLEPPNGKHTARAKVDISDEGPSRELAELFADGLRSMKGVKAPDVDRHLIDGMASVRIVARQVVDDDVDSDRALTYVIRWMFTVDDFWRYRVQTAKKLREHFATMWPQALAHYNQRRGSGGVRSSSGGRRAPPTQPSRNFGDGYIRIPDDHPSRQQDRQQEDNDDDG